MSLKIQFLRQTARGMKICIIGSKIKLGIITKRANAILNNALINSTIIINIVYYVLEYSFCIEELTRNSVVPRLKKFL